MDNRIIKKVMTFKSGNFAFSARYSEAELSGLLIETRLLYGTIADLPILPEWSAYLEKELIRRSIFSTAAIEGSPLREEEVGRIMLEQSTSDQKDSEAKKEIRNLQKVYDYIKTVPPATGPYELTEAFIREIHRIITSGLDYRDNLPGKYRNHTVKVGDSEHGGIYTPPKCQADIAALMKEFAKWINSKEVMALDSLIRAALAHYHLGLIHPFGNGNGRTIRIIEAMLLRTSGIKYVPTMLSNYYYRNIDDYYISFSRTRKAHEHDVTLFLKFMLEGVAESLIEIKNDVIFRIRQLVMRDYCSALRSNKDITQRQYDLLSLLLDRGGTVSLKDLFNVAPYNTLYRNVSERTARRDLAKLSDLALLAQEDGVYRLEIKNLG